MNPTIFPMGVWQGQGTPFPCTPFPKNKPWPFTQKNRRALHCMNANSSADYSLSCIDSNLSSQNIDMLLKKLSTCRGTVYPRLWPVLLHSFAFLGQTAGRSWFGCIPEAGTGNRVLSRSLAGPETIASRQQFRAG